MSLAAMVMGGQLPGGRSGGDWLIASEEGRGGNEPPRRTRETSLLSKMVPVVKKKTLVDLLGLTPKLGYFLFVPKKKKPEIQLIEGPVLRTA